MRNLTFLSLKLTTVLVMALAAALLLTGCNKDDDKPNSGPRGGDGDGSAYAMSWKDGGTTYNATNATTARTTVGEQFFMITGIANGLMPLPSLTLTIYGITTGTYTLTEDAANGNKAIYLTTTGDYGTDRAGGSGTVTISAINWADGGSLQGTYTLTVVGDDDTRTLTGSFNTAFANAGTGGGLGGGLGGVLGGMQ